VTSTKQTAVYIDKDTALAALRAAAWEQPADPADATCGHPGCTDHPADGRMRIHTTRGGFGADWDLTKAEAFVNTAQRCAWVDNFMHHDLGVIGQDGKPVYFEVRRVPDDAAHGHD
jgi:hypothetical protein